MIGGLFFLSAAQQRDISALEKDIAALKHQSRVSGWGTYHRYGA